MATIYDRHSVGITCGVMCRIKGRRCIVLFEQHSIRWFMMISVCSLACQQRVFHRYHGENIYQSFTHKMAAKAS